MRKFANLLLFTINDNPIQNKIICFQLVINLLWMICLNIRKIFSVDTNISAPSLIPVLWSDSGTYDGIFSSWEKGEI